MPRWHEIVDLFNTETSFFKVYSSPRASAHVLGTMSVGEQPAQSGGGLKQGITLDLLRKDKRARSDLPECLSALSSLSQAKAGISIEQ